MVPTSYQLLKPLLRCLGKNFSFLCTLVGIYLVERKGNIRHGTAILQQSFIAARGTSDAVTWRLSLAAAGDQAMAPLPEPDRAGRDAAHGPRHATQGRRNASTEGVRNRIRIQSQSRGWREPLPFSPSEHRRICRPRQAGARPARTSPPPPRRRATPARRLASS